MPGVLYQRGAIAEVGAEISSVLPGGEHRTADTEGLVLRLRGDGKQYALVLKTSEWELTLGNHDAVGCTNDRNVAYAAVQRMAIGLLLGSPHELAMCM